MFENILKFFKKAQKGNKVPADSKSAAKERLHLVLMQDRANVSADFLDLMKQEIIDVIKKYIEVDESAIDVRLTNKENEDGTNGAPALYANIPILNIKNEARKVDGKDIEEKEVDVKQADKEQVVEEPKTEEIKNEEKVDAINEEVKEENAETNENTQKEQEEKVDSETETTTENK